MGATQSRLRSSASEDSPTTGDNATTSPLPAPLTEFEYFPRLPPELRLMIWKQAMPEPRVIDTSHLYMKFIITDEPHKVTDREKVSSRKTPVLLHVCKESRVEALKVYQVLEVTGLRLGLDSHRFVSKFYIDYERDTVYFNHLSFHLNATPNEDGFPWWYPMSYQPFRGDFRKVRHFAFRGTISKLNHTMQSTDIVGMDYGRFLWNCCVQTFNPESVTLVQHFTEARRLLGSERDEGLFDERVEYTVYEMRAKSRMKLQLPTPPMRMMAYDGEGVFEKARGLGDDMSGTEPGYEFLAR